DLRKRIPGVPGCGIAAIDIAAAGEIVTPLHAAIASVITGWPGACRRLVDDRAIDVAQGERTYGVVESHAAIHLHARDARERRAAAIDIVALAIANDEIGAIGQDRVAGDDDCVAARPEAVDGPTRDIERCPRNVAKLDPFVVAVVI